MKRIYLLWILIVGMTSGLGAQSWKTVSSATPDERVIFLEPLPEAYGLFAASAPEIRRVLTDAPQEKATASGVSFNFPVDDKGRTETFEMKTVAYMEPGLASRYSALKTYLGKSKSGKILYLTVTPYEITGIVRRPGAPTVLVKPYTRTTWIAYSIDRQHFTDEGFECDVQSAPLDDEDDAVYAQRPDFNDGTLRQYRYAPSITGEYSQYTLNRLGISASASEAEKKQAILGAVLAAVTRINSVYEKDMAMRLVLVDNEDRVIFLDPNTDPFDNSASNMTTLLGQNQTTVDNNIGSANYDVSQVWCQGNLQGLAQLGVVCGSSKGRGAIRGQNPETDRYIISVACHEMGHQFGANHVFSNSSCGGRRNDNTAVETGSGTTIMAYAGICPPDVQDWTDDRFNYISIKEFRSGLLSYGTGSCSVNSAIGHRPPTVDAGAEKYIPKETPFMLSATVSDEDGDPVTLVWDEEDKPANDQNISTPPQSDWTTGPMFRPYPERDTTVRFFPNIDSLLAGRTSTTWEVLPSVTRILKFNVTARDNHPGGGQTNNDVITLGVRDDAGPFRITSQQTPVTWTPGQQVTVTWDVAGTDGGYINCQNVDIIFSPHGGYDFIDTLAANVPNNGSATFTLPASLDSPNGRIMVKARDNYFLSINPARIMVGNYSEQCDMSYASQPRITIPDNDTNGITDTIHIDENRYITDVNVGVQITHNYVRDLKIMLIAPNGREIVLWNNNCGSEDNLNVIFDDEGDSLDCNQLSGNIKPVQFLSVLNDTYTAGDWVLKVIDNAQPDEGTLQQWSLDFCYLVDVPRYDIKDIKIYPVPADTYLQVEFQLPSQDDVEISITDLTGRLIYQSRNKADQQIFYKKINVNRWPAGNYILTVRNGIYEHKQMIQTR